jgi:hypothetical protein
MYIVASATIVAMVKSANILEQTCIHPSIHDL